MPNCGVTRRLWTLLLSAVRPSPIAWTGATLGLYALWAFMILWAFWINVLPHFSAENAIGDVALYGYLALAGGGLWLVFSLANRLKPPYRSVFFLVLPTVGLFAALIWEQGAPLVLLVLLGGISLLFGAAASLLTKPAFMTGSTAWLLTGVAICGLGLHALLAPVGQLNPGLAGFHLQDRTLELPNPGKRGPYSVTSFSYGSGHDRHRPEYGKLARLITQSVDGSKLDPSWSGVGGWLLSHYWGFDAAHMPLQALVWMPQGKGPFPLVLIVHGNHAMDQPSDPGYAYLGQLLASQGFIFVSVDENFLNDGGAGALTNPFPTSVGKEMAARAWVLLEHLKQWSDWNSSPSSFLYAKVDMDQIALIGHSRGGEAVVVADLFNGMGAYPDDATVPFDFHFHLRAIAAIAPTEGLYELRSSHIHLRDQNYLVMGGSLDGDNGTSFLGEAQYSRATFSGQVDVFKASVYINGANHGQFNTAWGRNDAGTVYKFLTDERYVIPAIEQRQIAQVYLAAFLDITLKGQTGYRALFQDPRNGAAWLPGTLIVSNYADGQTRWLTDFEHDADPTTGANPDVAIMDEKLSVWREDDPELKLSKLGTHLAILGWDRVHPHATASYRIAFREPLRASPDSALVFSASQIETDTLPTGFQTAGRRSKPDAEPLDWTIELTDAAGQTARLALSRDQLLYPQIKGEPYRGGIIRGHDSELVMRRYCFPIHDFLALNPNLNPGRLVEIRFAFDHSRQGAIALNDVGLAPTR
jgi:hypothetical protein